MRTHPNKFLPLGGVRGGLLLIALVGFAVSCKTSKSSVSVRGKCETLSQSSERLSTTLAIDTFSKFFALNADSLIITFVSGEQDISNLSPLTSYLFLPSSNPSPNDLPGSLDDVYAFSDKSHAAAQLTHEARAESSLLGLCLASRKKSGGQPSAHADGAPTAHSKPTAIKVYGLHASTGSSKQSIQQSSLADSNDKSEQSATIKEDNVKKSSPFPLARYIFIFLIIAAAIYIFFKVRR